MKNTYWTSRYQYRLRIAEKGRRAPLIEARKATRYNLPHVLDVLRIYNSYIAELKRDIKESRRV